MEGGSFPGGSQKERSIWKELRFAASKGVAAGRKEVCCGSVARPCLTETVVTSGVLLTGGSWARLGLPPAGPDLKIANILTHLLIF